MYLYLGLWKTRILSNYRTTKTLNDLHTQFEQYNLNYLNDPLYQDIKDKTGKPEALTRSNAHTVIKRGIEIMGA